MAKPPRNASPESIARPSRTFFVTTSTFMRKSILQSDRNATLLTEVFRSCVAAKHFRLHDFVIMPDHVHLLLTVSGETTVEKAMQFIKGGFSFRLKRETGHNGEVWQRGFSDHRVRDRESYKSHRTYIAMNPVRAGLAKSPEDFPWCLTNLARQKAAQPERS
ncbi:MAG TPA: transposase [Acidobacteriaceae bacterium]|jgi:putative transposase|nr:transposase [Acidobacteriaceae bacterium]